MVALASRFLLALALLAGTLSIPSSGAETAEMEVVLQNPQVTPGGIFRFGLVPSSGPSFPSFELYASEDLARWTLLTNGPAGAGLFEFEDRETPRFRHRFYRVGPAIPIPLPEMVLIPAGKFVMGSPATEPGRSANEGPLTVVSISRGFWIGQFEVNQRDYAQLMESLPFFDGRLPIDLVSWTQATNYCHKLTVRERSLGRLPFGYVYRLPTEAEWEYACRAGSATPVAVGVGTSLSSTQANFDGTFPYGGAAAGPYRRFGSLPGSFPPNAWGLYDMHGNVAEWCQDVFAPYPGGEVTDPKGPETGTQRVLRGGGYTSTGSGCRSARRDSRSATLTHFPHGFRVVLSQSP